MIESRKELNNVYQTGEEMRRLVCTYWADLGPWLDVPFNVFYRHVCALPYVEDPPGVETVSRPLYLLNPGYSPRDCDDKAILCACWFHAHRVPVRFVATSSRPDGFLHHVLLRAWGCGYIDATFEEFAETLGNYDYFHDVTRLDYLTKWF